MVAVDGEEGAAAAAMAAQQRAAAAAAAAAAALETELREVAARHVALAGQMQALADALAAYRQLQWALFLPPPPLPAPHGL